MITVVQWILVALQVLSALLLIVLVLLHSPKGDGIASIGGGGSIFASQKGAESTLNRITGWAAGTFFVSAFLLGYYF